MNNCIDGEEVCTDGNIIKKKGIFDDEGEYTRRIKSGT